MLKWLHSYRNESSCNFYQPFRYFETKVNSIALAAVIAERLKNLINMFIKMRAGNLHLHVISVSQIQTGRN